MISSKAEEELHFVLHFTTALSMHSSVHHKFITNLAYFINGNTSRIWKIYELYKSPWSGYPTYALQQKKTRHRVLHGNSLATNKKKGKKIRRLKRCKQENMSKQHPSKTQQKLFHPWSALSRKNKKLLKQTGETQEKNKIVIYGQYRSGWVLCINKIWETITDKFKKVDEDK